MNNMTEPEPADVDLARAILSVKPYGNDNLLWLPSQGRLPISLLFRVRFSGLEILAGLANQSQRLDYLVRVEPHVAGCVLYDTAAVMWLSSRWPGQSNFAGSIAPTTSIT
jgi:hypothetical protein